METERTKRLSAFATYAHPIAFNGKWATVRASPSVLEGRRRLVKSELRLTIATIKADQDELEGKI
jgi:hypothetical protein